MKQFFTITYLLLLANFSFAQLPNLEISSLKVNMAVKSTDFDVQGDSHVKSLATTTTTWQWERTVVGLPATWKTQICDANLCWGSAVSFGTFDLLPGQEFELAAHARPGGTDGSGIIYVKLTEVGTANSVTVEYNINEYTSSTLNLNDFSELKIFPNPVRDHFTLQNVPSVIKSIRLSTITGRNLCQFDVTPDLRFDMPVLESGSYLLMLEDDKLQVRKTMIINKL